MGIIMPVFFAILHLLAAATDLLFLLTLVRLLHLRWGSVGWLRAADTVGRPLTDFLLWAAATRLRLPGRRPMNTIHAAWMVLFALGLARLWVRELAHATMG